MTSTIPQGLPESFVGYENPPADYRLNSILQRGPNSGLPLLRQGLMQQTADWYKQTQTQNPADLATAMASQPFPYRVNFHYNPSDISVSYVLDPSVTMPSQLTPDQLAASAIAPGQTSYSFDLLFDRTYECWDGGYWGPPPLLNNQTGVDLRDVGCWIDIAFFERMTGVVVSDGNGGVVRQNLIPVPLLILSGGGATTNGNDPTSLLPLVGLPIVGYITSATVDYTHFTSRMVPVRAALSVTVQELMGVTVKQAIQGAASGSDSQFQSYGFSKTPVPFSTSNTSANPTATSGSSN